MPFLRNAFLMAGQGGVARLSGFLTTVALSRLLPPGDVGIYGLVVNTAGSVYGLTRLGTDAAITVSAAHGRDTVDGRAHQGRVLGAGLALLTCSALLGSLVCLLFSAVIASAVFGRSELGPWIAAAAVFVALNALTQFCYRTLLGFGRLPQYARVMAVTAGGGLLLTVSAAAVGGVAGAVTGLAVTQALAVLWLHHATRRAMSEEGVRIRFDALRSEARRILRHGIPFYLAGLAIIPATYFAQGLLSRHGGVEALGGLRVITSMLTLVTLVPMAVAPLILQRLSVAASGGDQGFSASTFRLLKYSWIFAVVVGMTADLLAPVLMAVFFGDAYSQHVPVVSLALFSTMFAVVASVVTNIMLATGRVMLILRYTLVQATVFVGVAVVMVPEHGLTGYFIADICGRAAVFGALLCMKGVMRTILGQSWIRPAISVTALYASVAWLSMTGDGISRHVIASMGLCIACTLIYLTVFEREERSRIIRMFTTALGR